jgi:diadenosine tetraphosphate (Ap4A) HIT family hydrolase
VAEFAVDPAFQAGSIAVGDLPLCQVRLQADARWPWLVLIPRRPGLREVEDLSAVERARLIEETVLAGQAVRALGAATGFAVQKLNIGALGNVTPQLHVHVVGRRAGDPAWPGPVWGVGVAEAYGPDAFEAAVAAVRATLNP